jgi:hypothetical protein
MDNSIKPPNLSVIAYEESKNKTIELVTNKLEFIFPDIDISDLKLKMQILKNPAELLESIKHPIKLLFIYKKSKLIAVDFLNFMIDIALLKEIMKTVFVPKESNLSIIEQNANHFACNILKEMIDIINVYFSNATRFLNKTYEKIYTDKKQQQAIVGGLGGSQQVTNIKKNISDVLHSSHDIDNVDSIEKLTNKMNQNIIKHLAENSLNRQKITETFDVNTEKILSDIEKNIIGEQNSKRQTPEQKFVENIQLAISQSIDKNNNPIPLKNNNYYLRIVNVLKSFIKQANISDEFNVYQPIVVGGKKKTKSKRIADSNIFETFVNNYFSEEQLHTELDYKYDNIIQSIFDKELPLVSTYMSLLYIQNSLHTDKRFDFDQEKQPIDYRNHSIFKKINSNVIPTLLQKIINKLKKNIINDPFVNITTNIDCDEYVKPGLNILDNKITLQECIKTKVYSYYCNYFIRFLLLHFIQNIHSNFLNFIVQISIINHDNNSYLIKLFNNYILFR